MAVAGACVIAGVIAAWSGGAFPGASPVDVIGSRFPDGKAVLADTAVSFAAEDPIVSPGAVVDARFPAKEASRPYPYPRPHSHPRTRHAAVAEADEFQRALFSPLLAYPPPAAQPADPVPPQAAVAAETTVAEAPAAASRPAAAEAPVAASSSAVVAAPAPASRPAVVAAVTVLNDAQIASIKGRLNLTPEQERMWPAVEVALRRLAYARADHGAPKSGARRGAHARDQVAAIDPASDDVKHLKSAAVPLITSFNGDQERELRMFAQITGLDKLIPGRNSDHAF
ncbi:MAG: hypothetical protein ABSG76_10580 [Xanthobacteraceae bacterium]|jgi:hypothetical protein